MDFSDFFRQELSEFSPDGRLVATSVAHRVVIRSAETLQIAAVFECPHHPISRIEWSPDSILILACNLTSALSSKKIPGTDGMTGWIRVFSVIDQQWQAKIDEGIVGLAACRFTPDSRHVMSWSDHQLRLTVWSLLEDTDPEDGRSRSYFVRFPKYSSSERGHSFRRDGRYLAYLERSSGKDQIGIIDCKSWSLIKQFPVSTNDAQDLEWSPDGRYLAVWDSLLDYSVQIYTPDGRRVANYTPHDWDQTRSLGVSLVRWSPSSQFLAVASHDHKVRFLNNYTWQSLIELTIPRTVSSDECHAFTETFGGESEEIAKIRSDVHYDAAQTSTNLPTAKQSGENKLHLSISSLSWNISVHLSPVRVMQWNPQRPSVLAIACQNSSNVYIWNGESCSCYPVPMAELDISSIKWNPDGCSLIVSDKEKFCAGFAVGSI